MIWDRLGVITDEVSQHLGEALDWAAANGLKHVEIRMIGGRNVMELSDEEADGVRRETEARGLFVSCLASPVFKCSLDPTRPAAAGDTFGQEEQSVQAHFAKLERAIGIAKRLGTHRIRIFSFWREAKPSLHRAEIVSKLKAAAEAAEREQIVLLLENEPACNGGYADEVAGLVRAVDSVYMKVLWDPGNEVYGGRFAYPDGYREVKDVLDHVHLKDAVIREGGAPGCVPIGRGNVPISEQIRALEADGYQGLYTLETHYIPEGGTAKDGTAMTLEGLRAVLK
ncbi:sugar phosphate isomerase/epimerase family protein [Paenibacillus sp. NPDC056579]|uniref:sugar phosphate isomerase/epimerase family protein n=1 Tax=Paenibacillus sp. NPDC056579 TaxID=3345871 RepID=UPI00367F9E27